jgi:predicted molibdopterin-dependent oxidoreductase YjgC
LAFSHRSQNGQQLKFPILCATQALNRGLDSRIFSFSSIRLRTHRDAAKLGLNGATRVRVRSRRGEMIARAVVTERVAPGVVFANFHFPGAQNVNNLTTAALDPVAKIPEYKVCAVAIEAADVHQTTGPKKTLGLFLKPGQ